MATPTNTVCVCVWVLLNLPTSLQLGGVPNAEHFGTTTACWMFFMPLNQPTEGTNN